MISKEFHKTKRQNLLDQLMDKSVLLVFAGEAPKRTADLNYPFTPNRNFYYLTGFAREKAVLLLAKYGEQQEEILLIEKPSQRQERSTGKMAVFDETQELTGIDTVKYLDELDSSLSALINNRSSLVERDFVHVYFDFETGSFSDPLDEPRRFARRMAERFPYLSIQNAHHLICNMRIEKTPEEIEKIRQAIDITNEGIRQMLLATKPGVMEYELEAAFDFALKSRGVKNTAFDTIVASGDNAIILHYGENNQMVEKNDLILIDLGAEYEYYAADISRTFPATGKFTNRQKVLYNIVLKSQEETIRAMKPGQELEGLVDITRGILAEECRKIGLIESDQEISKYFFHGVSHYLGLDTHDVGERAVRLRPGMVLTVEPGLYIPEEGVGIRIEDDVLITEDGNEILSQAIPKTVAEIEGFMQNRLKEANK